MRTAIDTCGIAQNEQMQLLTEIPAGGEQPETVVAW